MADVLADVGLPKETRKTFLYQLEADRNERIKVWHRLLDKYKDEKGADDRLPAMTPFAWTKAPEHHFRPFLCSKDEIHRVAELNVTVIVMCTKEEPAWLAFRANPSKPDPDQDESEEEEEEVKVGDPEDDETYGRTVYGLDDDLKHLRRNKMKFLVYCTAEIPHKTLEIFLDLAPHSRQEFTDEEQPHWRPYKEGIWDDAAFLLKTETPLEQVTRRTTLPLEEETHLPFIHKRSREIIEDYYQSMQALKGHRHFFSSHCFVELDSQTAEDQNTVCIWSDSSGEGWDSRRCEFGALMYNLHPIESVMVGLHQLCSEDDTLTVKMMRKEIKGGRRKKRERGFDVSDSEEDDLTDGSVPDTATRGDA